MTDTIIKNAGNSRSIRSVANLGTLAPTYEKLLELLTGVGLPIDLGPLNPAGCEVVGTPLDAEHLITMESGSYIGTGKRGPSNAVSLTFSRIPKLIVVYTESGSYSSYAPGFGFISPLMSKGLVVYNVYSGGASALNTSSLRILIDGTTVKWYYGGDQDDYGGTMLNANLPYYYHAFL